MLHPKTITLEVDIFHLIALVCIIMKL